MLRILRGVARAVVDLGRHTGHHVLNVAGGKGLLGAVRRDAQGLTEEHSRILGEELADDLNLGRRQPPRHAGELVTAALWMIREETVVAHQGDLDCLKDGVAKVVDELHHLGVVIAAIEDGRDAQQNRLLHAQKWNHDLADEPRVAVRRLLEDDHIARDTFQRLHTARARQHPNPYKP